ncbi:MAG: hypothetical protein DME85_07205 [Verrucomicrobia bacterium]|nr:MAG: hypothetical protein DME85_07205 [Verrucomicrobiota bacterium]
MNNFTKYAAMLALVLGWFFSGCGKNALEPAAPVPVDCQKFLDKYFEAVKSKDVGKIKEFSSYVSRVQSEGMPASSIDMMRETRGRFAADVFERMNKELGDFQSYSVISAKETTVTTAELAAKKMQGTGLQGIHAEIICKAKFSKKHSALIGLNLFKETQDSDYSVEAWRYQAEP